ncbi:glycoside hydrolase family 43 protein [uncultured Sphaerochaeta sp.]|uniref:glycoside hydrolase family 43 protein n=1 Tax=uncultured Sphaerochaeta sp. TaxID=886478 RepID=UPI0029C9B4D6|nr:glycoside hydrolase family 43 protein [uncultured Sphaerochaeta sp.]
MKTYTNPLSHDGLRPDPFILRFDGTYYLYVTHPQILCWSSKDLVSWKEEGPVIAEQLFGDLVPFAPEVIYVNGWFYMYASPSGTGHCVLRSTSPTGPFTLHAEGLERSLDGSPFMDDDGNLYLYWADDRGILGCAMQSPSEPGETVLVCKTDMGWTEGPQVLKEDGLYYLTYCGNHYLSKGYRIYCAVSTNPLGPYKNVSAQPILVQTNGPCVGLGHCSTVWGPDLQVRYMAYHNLNKDRSRDFSIAPVSFSPSEVSVLGHCNYEQPVPKLPDVTTKVISSAQQEWEPDRAYDVTGAVAEVSMISATLPFGVCFGALALTVTAEHKLVVRNHECTLYSALLPFKVKPKVLHTFVMQSHEGMVSIFLDGLLVAAVQVAQSNIGPIGSLPGENERIITHAQLSYGSRQKAFEALAIPIPAKVNMRNACKVNVPSAGTYLVHRSTQNTDLEAAQLQCEKMFLKKGVQTLQCGSSEQYMVIHKRAQQLTATAQWKPKGAYGKYVCGDTYTSAFEMHAVVKRNQMGPEGSFGVMFRVTDQADGGEGSDPVLGRNFFNGYSCMISAENITLFKHMYCQEPLVEVPHTEFLGKPLSLKVIAKEQDIQIFFEDRLLLTYRDTKQPFLYGKVGIRYVGSLMDSAEITLTCLD